MCRKLRYRILYLTCKFLQINVGAVLTFHDETLAFSQTLSRVKPLRGAKGALDKVWENAKTLTMESKDRFRPEDEGQVGSLAHRWLKLMEAEAAFIYIIPTAPGLSFVFPSIYSPLQRDTESMERSMTNSAGIIDYRNIVKLSCFRPLTTAPSLPTAQRSLAEASLLLGIRWLRFLKRHPVKL